MEKLTVFKFEGKDFGVWKFQMQQFLDYHGLLEVVDGSVQRPDDATEAEKWDKLDKNARFAISQALSINKVRQIMTLSTAKEMWKRLAVMHEKKDPVSINLLQQRFFEYKMDSKMSVADHVAAVEEMAKQLKDLGQDPGEMAIMTKVLTGLPARFRPMVSAWDSEPNKTLENLMARLMKEEELDKSMGLLHLHDVDDTTALCSRTDKNENEQKKRATSENSEKPKFKGKCNYCKRKGHIKKHCWKLKADRQPGQVNTVSASETGEVFSAASRELSDESGDVWLADSGASEHMTPRREWFNSFIPIEDESRPVTVGNNEIIFARGKGTILFKSQVGQNTINCVLSDVLWVPKLGKNLFSLGAAIKQDCDYEGGKFGLRIKRNGQVKIIGKEYGYGLCKLNIQVIQPVEANLAIVKPISKAKIHQRFGHVCEKSVNELINGESVIGLVCSDPKSDLPVCDPCLRGKQHKKPYEESKKRAKKPGDLIHFDVVGPMSEKSLGGAEVMAIFKDDASDWLTVIPMKNRSEITDAVQEVLTDARAEGHVVRRLRSDNAKEFKSTEFKKIMQQHLIKQEFSTPRNPQQNGRAERANRTVGEMARTMLADANLPRSLWAEAAKASAVIRNRIPLKRLGGRTPYEVWTGDRPDVSMLRVYGSRAYKLIDTNRPKFSDKSVPMVLVGYEPEKKAYRLWESGTKKVHISRDVEVFEADDMLTTEVTLLKDDEQHTISEKSHNEENQDIFEDSVASRTRSKTGPIKAPWLGDGETNIVVAAKCLVAETIPTSLEEARASTSSGQWEAAMNDELTSLSKNETWTLVDLPEGQKPIKNKWVYRIKTKPDGTVDRFKARLVVKGCSQKYGRDYFDVFSPVARYESVRLILAEAAAKDYELVQFDVKTAFLYGKLTETIYMEQPEGFNDGSGRVCKLKKALYGLKQAPLEWNKRCDEVFKRCGLKRSPYDPCVYVTDNHDLILVLYVDDGLVASRLKANINELYEVLKREFDITISEADCYLGLQLVRDRISRTMQVHQTAYALNVLKKFNMEDCNEVAMPADPSVILRKNVGENGEQIEGAEVPYRQLIGSLMYLSIATRPDISFVVNKLSQYLENPSEVHWNAAKRILRYLKGTLGLGLSFGAQNEGEAQLRAFSDADFAACVDTRRSTSGVVLMYNAGPVVWLSRKQNIVATSTADAEYMAAHEAAKEIVWIRGLLTSLGVQQEEPTKLYLDNAAAECLIKNPVFHRRSKHVDIKFHFTRDLVQERKIQIMHVASENQVADIFTKVLVRDKFIKNRKLLNLQ